MWGGFFLDTSFGTSSKAKDGRKEEKVGEYTSKWSI